MFNITKPNSLTDKVAIVTGANSGIGFEIAKTLSSTGATVIIACRDAGKGTAAERLIGGDARYWNLDLASFSNIEEFGKTIATKYSKIDFLIYNAGVMSPPFTKTINQLELTFGVNYIGYYFLTNKLMPLLRRVKGSRIINMSSIAQYRVTNINWENINSTIHYNKQEAYDLSNLFRIMFTFELQEKLREKQYETIAVACHPGVTMTNISRFMPSILRNPVFAKIMNALIFHSPYKAAMPALMAATAPNIKGGEFIGLDTIKQYKGNPKIVLPNQLAYNKELRTILWQKSVEITGIDLE